MSDVVFYLTSIVMCLAAAFAFSFLLVVLWMVTTSVVAALLRWSRR